MFGSRKAVFILVVLFMAAAFDVSSEDEPASAFFEEVREYYADVAGYHGFGTASMPAAAEAERLAKANALKRIFLEIGKDELFQEICISLWPESIRQEEFAVRKNGDGGYTAAVRILLERTAVVLTERNYAVNAASLLERSEAQNNRIQETVASGLKAEEEMRLPEAMTLFRQAKAGCLEVRTLLKKLTDNSVLSQSGMTRSSVLQITSSLEQSSDDGLSRIAKAEEAVKITDSATETEESLRLFEQELSELSEKVHELLELSPFFDLPREKLDAVSIDLENIERTTILLNEKFTGIRLKSEDGRSVMREKVNLALSDLKTLSDHAARMRNEVKEEIRYPRLARQEDAYRRAEMFKAIGDTAAWIFLHDPKDYLRVNWEIPFGYVLQKGWTGGLDSDLAITAEGTFSSGFWVQTAFLLEETSYYSLPVSAVRNDISQNVAIGVFDGSLFGLGFTWDWGSSLKYGGSTGALDPKSKITAYLGSVDRNRLRPSLLFSASWTIPSYWDELILPYHVNAELLVLLRLENILIIEGGLASGCQRFGGLPGSFENKLVYSVSWKAGAALRFPGPFAWGVRFAGGAESELEGGMPSRLRSKPSAWRGYVQYSF